LVLCVMSGVDHLGNQGILEDFLIAIC